jgi:polar amino acid transport system permease protein
VNGPADAAPEPPAEVPPAPVVTPSEPELITAVPLRHPWRWVSAVVMAGLLGLFIYGAATNSAYDWHTFGKYLFTHQIAEGGWNTLQLTVLAMAIGIGLGVVTAVMRLSPNPVVRSTAWLYLWFFRGTPVYVQLLFWGLISVIYPQIAIGIPFVHQFFHIDTRSTLSYFVIAALGLGVNESAYMAEIVRAGINSVGEGQVEAATALGMGRTLTMRRIVLPQAMRVIIPPTGNELISMLKTTSLVTIVPYSLDLFARAQAISSRIYRPVPLVAVAAAWYLAFTSVLMVGQYFLEKRYARGLSRTMTARQRRAQLLAERAAETGR